MMVSRNRGWIGIDLGTHAVKLVQVERQGGRIQLAEAMLIRRSEPWSDAINDSAPAEESGEEIRAGIALGNDFAGRSAAITLPMTVCDLRPCTIGEGNETDIRARIAEDLSAFLGEIDGTREFDYWVAESGERNGNSDNGLVASISSGWAQQVATDLTNAGLLGKVLDVLPTALARAVEIGFPGASRSPLAAVDWGSRRGVLCAVQHGRPMFVRTLRDAHSSAVTTALMKSLSVSHDEAQKLLTEHGLPPRFKNDRPEDGIDLGTESTSMPGRELPLGPNPELQAVIEEVIEEPLQIFLEELRRTITFLKQQRRAIAPSRIVLFGGGAAIRNIADYVSEHLELPAQTWSLDGRATAGRARIPMELLGPAVALSALAWSRA